MNVLNKSYKVSLVWKSLLLFASVTLLPIHSEAQTVKSPEKIHKSVSPSVALIRDIESHGSGVVITKGGLLITNYHVVASGLPLEVTVKVKKDNKIQNITFKDLKVWKVHPKYDLALIQLPSEGVKFAAANLHTEKQSIAAGAACYAIGNPAGAKATLDQSITNGLVSSANRVVDGLKYIQVSCALNPGNSGGAICNNKGTVIGIATWKLGQAENIGFAIPTSQIKLGEFIPIKDRKSNLELAIKYEKEGAKFADLAKSLVGEDRDLAIRIATIYYRKTLENAPNDPSPYNNIGAMYYRLKEDAIARKYLERAMEMRPLYASSASMLGVILERTDKNQKAALEMWFKHSKDTKNPLSASECLENIAIYYINTQQFSQAAYTIKWANSIHLPAQHRRGTRKQILQASSEKLTEAQFDFLQSKAGNYSKEDMATFAKGKLAKSNAKKGDTPKSLTGILKINQSVYIKAAEAKLSKAVNIGPEGLSMPLPAEPGKIIMGYAGAYLLIEFPTLKRIGILDICSGRMIKYISLREEKCQFAAGGNILLIYLPKAKKFQLWDMKTWKMKAEKSFRSTRTIHTISMGILNHNFALVSMSSNDRRNMDSLGILSLPDCKLTTPKWTSPKGVNNLNTFFAFLSERNSIELEETGRYATVNSSGCTLIDLSNESSPMLDFYHGHNMSSFALGGKYLLSKNNTISSKYQLAERQDLLGERLKKYNPQEIPQGRRIVKIAGFQGIAHIAKRVGKDGEILVRDLKTLNILSSTDLPKIVYNKYSSGSSRNNTILASAYVQRCVFIDKNNKRLTIFPLTLDAKVIAKADKIAKPGAPISRIINVPAGSKVSIEGELEGASFDPKTNTLTWKIPADFERGTKESIILLITAADGTEDYHVEQIYVP